MSDVLSLRFDLSVDRIGEGWVARSHMMGFAVYASTAEATEKRANDAVDFFVASTLEHRGLDILRQWFDNHQVSHSFGSHTGKYHKNVERELSLANS